MHQYYRAKTRRNGRITIAFSAHAIKRLKERHVDLIVILSTLTVVSDTLCQVYGSSGDIVVINEKENLSIILNVSKDKAGFYYFNLITIFDFIPKTIEGKLAFYNISKFVAA